MPLNTLSSLSTLIDTIFNPISRHLHNYPIVPIIRDPAIISVELDYQTTPPIDIQPESICLKVRVSDDSFLDLRVSDQLKILIVCMLLIAEYVMLLPIAICVFLLVVAML